MIELNSGSDKDKFRPASAAGSKSANWPVYKGASLDLWQPDTGTHYASVNANTIRRFLHKKRLNAYRTSTSAFSLLDEDVVNDPETLPCLFPRIAFRDIARATDKRTILAALVPGGVVLADQAPYLLRIEGDAKHDALLLGYLSSMVLDWYARRVVELHLKFYLVNNFPIPDADPAVDPIANRVVEIAGRLAAVDSRYSDWASEVGVPVGSVTNDNMKKDLIHELDACVALLYELEEDDLEVLYTTFDEKCASRYIDRHAAVLKHFRKWQRRVDDSGKATGRRT